jgi:hypothetical protein
MIYGYFLVVITTFRVLGKVSRILILCVEWEYQSCLADGLPQVPSPNFYLHRAENPLGRFLRDGSSGVLVLDRRQFKKPARRTALG